MNWKIIYVVAGAVAGLWAIAVVLSALAMFRALTNLGDNPAVYGSAEATEIPREQ